jgi:hypothetical protein
MAEKAYIGLNEENCWTLYYGDGTEDQKFVLAVGQPFEPGEAIREVINEMEQWAWENGYELNAPLYSKADLTQQEVFDEVFGTEDEAGDY